MEHLDSNFIRTHVQHRHINKSPKPCRIKTFKIGGRPPWKLWWKHPVKPHSLSYCTTMFCFPVYDLPLIRLFKALSIHRNYSHFLPGMIAFDGLICCFVNVSFFFSFSSDAFLETIHFILDIKAVPPEAVLWAAALLFWTRGTLQLPPGEPFQVNIHLNETVRKH